MIELSEALEIIRRATRPLTPGSAALADVVGHRLAEDVFSDIDSPPLDKSMMDGIAVRSADWASGIREFVLTGDVFAGGDEPPRIESGHAARIMTGARIPPGADAVIMVEETRPGDGGAGRIAVNAAQCKSGQNIMRRAATVAAGQRVLPAGHRVRPADIGALAEAGAATCRIFPRPSVSIIATGDELVGVDQRPGAGQIRNSNGPMLAALARTWCREVHGPEIARDNPDHLRTLVEAQLGSNVLVLSGGVSAGAADYVPQVLQNTGVQRLFHQVAIKPGKPVWFGVRRRDDAPDTLVFGLPGNPVSSLVCFRLLVEPCLDWLAGGQGGESPFSAELTRDHVQRKGRTTFWPSRLGERGGGRTVEPLNWKGSSDLLTVCSADCLAIFPGDRDTFGRGERIQVMALD
jgi:molybdopterin molybdotransferase